MSDRAFVHNAADPRQVKDAKRLEGARERRWLGSLQVVLNQAAGRLVLSELLERAGLYGSVYDASGSLMYFKEGRRNFGLELRAACERASEEGTDLMDRERRERRRTDEALVDATHTARAEEATP